MQLWGADERREVVEKLGDSELFGVLGESERERIVSECRTARFRKGVSIDNDEGMRYFNIVLAGSVKQMEVDPATGRSIVLFLLKPGDVFDVLSLLDGERHLSDLMAVEDLTLLRAPLETARRWLEEHPVLQKKFCAYVGRQMRSLEEFARTVVFDDTLTRLVKLILRYVDVQHPTEEGHYPVSYLDTLSHELLAEMIGSVRSVVTTQLQKLEKEELIIHRRGYLAIKRLEELKLRYNL